MARSLVDSFTEKGASKKGRKGWQISTSTSWRLYGACFCGGFYRKERHDPMVREIGDYLSEMEKLIVPE